MCNPTGLLRDPEAREHVCEAKRQTNKWRGPASGGEEPFMREALGRGRGNRPNFVHKIDERRKTSRTSLFVANNRLKKTSKVGRK
jgi:hypothetical protein